MALWYLSFADDTGFLGAAIVDCEAVWLVDAVRVAHACGINPGGEVLGGKLPDGEETERLRPYVDKLLSKYDLIEIFDGKLRRIDHDGEGKLVAAETDES